MRDRVENDRGLSRRAVIGAGVVGTVAAALSPFEAFGARAATPRLLPGGAGAGYGPLAPARDHATGLELLALPRGFQYISYGWTGDLMSDGIATPSRHDGMGALWARVGQVALVRNHERDLGTPFTSPAYDRRGGGGTTNLLFDPARGKWLESYASLSGTIRNCAGGLTPWGSWITCEETTDVVGAVRHGYIFDVPADGKGDAIPLREAGRFRHEAVAIDPFTGVMYLTEDATPAGFYRYLAPRPGRHGRTTAELDAVAAEPVLDLEAPARQALRGRTWAPGGTLQMLALEAGRSYSTYQDGTGTTYGASWVTIDDPDSPPGDTRPALQGQAAGAAIFTRLEGAWYADGLIYFVSTDGGPAAHGQVFSYDPARERVQVVFASSSAAVLNRPDNICVSPRGGLVLCEDGTGSQYLRGLTTDGEIFPLALNQALIPRRVHGKTIPPGDYRSSEWAGATFDPSGRWLFANLQEPGITFAITGPWREGAL